MENGQQYTTSLMKINVKSPVVEENNKTENKLEAFLKNETLLNNSTILELLKNNKSQLIQEIYDL